MSRSPAIILAFPLLLLAAGCSGSSRAERIDSIRRSFPSVKPESEFVLDLARRAGAALQDRDIDYGAILVNGRRCGNLLSYRVLMDGEVESFNAYAIYMKFFGRILREAHADISVTDAKGRPIRFQTLDDSRISSNRGSIKVTGRSIGQDLLEITRHEDGVSKSRTLNIPEDALTEEQVRNLERERGLDEGTTYNYSYWDKTELLAVPVRVEVGPVENIDLLGRAQWLTRVDVIHEKPGGEIRMDRYLNDEFETLKSIQDLGCLRVEIISCSREAALGELDIPEVLGRIDIPCPVEFHPILRDAYRYSEIEYVLELPGGGWGDFRPPASSHQEVRQDSSGRWIVKVRELRWPYPPRLPYTGDDPVALQALLPTQHVQSEEETIVSLAREATRRSIDAVGAALDIERYVQRYLEPDYNTGKGRLSALETASRKRGDCTEYAALTAAMCRAVGIPARLVQGLAYSETENQFIAHEWVEVFFDHRWFGLDPSTPSGFTTDRIALEIAGPDDELSFKWLYCLDGLRIADVRPDPRREGSPGIER